MFPHQEAYCLNRFRFSSEHQEICARCELHIIVTALSGEFLLGIYSAMYLSPRRMVNIEQDLEPHQSIIVNTETRFSAVAEGSQAMPWRRTNAKQIRSKS